MFTFSFSSAFAALPYAAKTADGNVITDETDYTGYSDAQTTYGTYGLSKAEQLTLVTEVKLAVSGAYGLYAAPAYKAITEAGDTAVAAIEAAKTNKEMVKAYAAFGKVLAANEEYKYSELVKVYKASGTDVTFTFDDTHDNYVAPGYGKLNVASNVYTLDASALTTADAGFKWLMDQGYYGYSSVDAWATQLGSKAVKKAFEEFWADYYIGQYLVGAVGTDTAKYAAMSTYGKTIKAEYDAVNGAVTKFVANGVPTWEDTVALLDKVAAFAKKYSDGSIAFTDYGTAMQLAQLAAENWNAANLDAATTALGKINTSAGVIAAKADVLSAAKTIVDTLDKYYEDYQDNTYKLVLTNAAYGALVNVNDVTTVLGALGKIASASEKTGEGYALDEAYEGFEAYSQEAGKTTYYFKDTEANVAGLEAARKAFDAYFADYANLYVASAQYGAAFDISDMLSNGQLVKIETKILAGEYNKPTAAGYDEKADKIDTSKLGALLNNATVTVKSTKLAAKKVRVQAKVDTRTLTEILNQLGAGSTVEYKFYHKAPGKSFKLTKTKTVNYITYTSKSLKAGKNSFRVGLVVKDAKGNVLATKSYKASTLAYRTIK